MLVRAASLSALLAAGLVAGCGGSSRHTPLPSGRPDVLSVLQDVARCFRTHGAPGFPDPIVRRGVPTFPDSAPKVSAAVQQACRSVIDRIPPDFTTTQPVSAADFHRLLRFARCVRTHGIPDWPDPNALGEFPINPRIQAGGKRLVLGPTRGCERMNPIPGGVHVVQGH